MILSLLTDNFININFISLYNLYFSQINWSLYYTGNVNFSTGNIWSVLTISFFYCRLACDKENFKLHSNEEKRIIQYETNKTFEKYNCHIKELEGKIGDLKTREKVSQAQICKTKREIEDHKSCGINSLYYSLFNFCII